MNALGTFPWPFVRNETRIVRTRCLAHGMLSIMTQTDLLAVTLSPSDGQLPKSNVITPPAPPPMAAPTSKTTPSLDATRPPSPIPPTAVPSTAPKPELNLTQPADASTLPLPECEYVHVYNRTSLLWPPSGQKYRMTISNFLCSLTRNLTSHSMENVAFHSLLRWKIITTNSHYITYTVFFRGWENVYILSFGAEGLPGLSD